MLKLRLIPVVLLFALLTTAAQADDEGSRIRHVLLLSVDGLHAVDLARWVESHPGSTLARLSRTGVTYAEARTPTPSDSFPGLLALVTGGTPRSTGVYYDDSYDRTLFAPGSNCSGSPGTEAVLDETVDFDLNQLFSGGIDSRNLPLAKDARGCHPVFPHSFLQVNTIFEVAKADGRRTAWSDKHPAYDLVNGPSGKGVDDLYTPEINSLIANGGTANGVDLAGTLPKCDGTNSLPPAKVQVYTDCIPAQEAYDDVKVQAVLNWIDGKRADGSALREDEDEGRVPAIFGMNFQAVSVGQKLPVGGYLDAAGTPTANLLGAIAHTDASIGRMVAALERRGLLESTLIVVTAKHGQSPIDRSRLAMEGGGHAPVQTVEDPIDFVNAADPNVDNVTFTNPNNGHAYAVRGHLQTDDVGIVWLQDQSASNVSAVVAQLQGNRAAIFADTLPEDTIFSQSITSGAALAAIFGDPTVPGTVAAARAPNVFIQPDAGVIYSGSSKKIAEHGGGTLDDTHVALLVSSPGLRERSVGQPVDTMQVAPTILKSLGLEPRALQAVRAEGTRVLPHLPF
ncbi:MAG TPA: alkaline phosphatase family protein [Myxococcales bacterium]|nr:alkaline phosphatase family protein [Myxococcales bacterium]